MPRGATAADGRPPCLFDSGGPTDGPVAVAAAAEVLPIPAAALIPPQAAATDAAPVGTASEARGMTDRSRADDTHDFCTLDGTGVCAPARTGAPWPRQLCTGTRREACTPPITVATTWRHETAASSRAQMGAARRRPARLAALTSSCEPAELTPCVRAAPAARGSIRSSCSVFIPPARARRGDASGHLQQDYIARSPPWICTSRAR